LTAKNRRKTGQPGKHQSGRKIKKRLRLNHIHAVMNAIAHIHTKPPWLTKQGLVAGGAAAIPVAGGLLLGIRLRFHHHAPQQLAIRLAFHQQAADELGGNDLSGAGEEALAGSGAGDQRATGTQAGGESQALRQWGEETCLRIKREYQRSEWSGVSQINSH